LEPVKTIPEEAVAQITETVVEVVVALPFAPVPVPLTVLAPQLIPIVKPITVALDVDKTPIGIVTQALLPAVRVPTDWPSMDNVTVDPGANPQTLGEAVPPTLTPTGDGAGAPGWGGYGAEIADGARATKPTTASDAATAKRLTGLHRIRIPVFVGAASEELRQVAAKSRSAISPNTYGSFGSHPLDVLFGKYPQFQRIRV
jgi:hypothetical protein